MLSVIFFAIIKYYKFWLAQAFVPGVREEQVDKASERWNIQGFDRSAAVRLCRQGLNPLVAVILSSRGACSPEAVAALTGDGGALSDPLLLIDMDRASRRVRQAIGEGEHMAVYGDYDVDGITASCLTADFLRSRGVPCEIYIPERLEEGYGLKAAALEELHRRGVTLVVTVDCGITAVEEARRARELGLDLVITDHHECGSALPDALAVVDPRRPDCPSPAKDLAGVGVAFKLICAVSGPDETEALWEEYGDLVAVGTVADVMPVVGENRALIRRGLACLREGRRPGLRELALEAGIDPGKITAANIGFALAPRINAAGRIGDTAVAVDLLLTRDRREASRLALMLCALNRERQRIEGEMFQEALQMLEEHPASGGPIVLHSSGWHQGVAGIVASKLTDKFGLPSVMICVKDGIGRGSCRSVEGFDLHEALSSCRDLLLSFGGHEMAAGLTIDEARIDDFALALRERFSPACAARRCLNVDFEVIKPELLTLPNVAAAEALEPYGVGNPQPVLCMRDMVVENVMSLSEGRHTKLWLRKGSAVFEALFFSHSADELGAKVGSVADAAFYPQINEFRGRRSVQLCLTDYYSHP